MSLSSLWRGVIPKGFELVAGDKRSAITGAQTIERHPERMPAAVCLASLRGCEFLAPDAILDNSNGKNSQPLRDEVVRKPSEIRLRSKSNLAGIISISEQTKQRPEPFRFRPLFYMSHEPRAERKQFNQLLNPPTI